jgi:hypothetical protein
MNFKQYHNNIIDTQASFKKYITRTNVLTLPRDIHKSKLAKIVAAISRFGKMRLSNVFFTIASNASYTKEGQEGN